MNITQNELRADEASIHSFGSLDRIICSQRIKVSASYISYVMPFDAERSWLARSGTELNNAMHVDLLHSIEGITNHLHYYYSIDAVAQSADDNRSIEFEQFVKLIFVEFSATQRDQ